MFPLHLPSRCQVQGEGEQIRAQARGHRPGQHGRIGDKGEWQISIDINSEFLYFDCICRPATAKLKGATTRFARTS